MKIKKIITFMFALLLSFVVLTFNSTKAANVSWQVTKTTTYDKYGMHHEQSFGKFSNGGVLGLEKNVNFYKMKTDGQNSKLVTWAIQSGNSGFATSSLTGIAEDYEKKHPGWIVVGGINADQWYYGTTKIAQKGGYYYFKNQSYYPFTMDGQNLFTISPTNGRSNGVAITNNPSSNSFIDITNSTTIELQVYDENNSLVAKFPVSSYNNVAGANQTTVWSGYISADDGVSFVKRQVTSTNDLYVIEKADLAYMNNARDYQEINTVQAAVDSFYGKGTITKVEKKSLLDKGQFAIDTTDSAVKAALSVGTKVIVEQLYDNAGANDVESCTGYHTVQIKNGSLISSTASYNTASKPRSVFGVTKDGSYFLMTTREQKLGSVGGTVHDETQALLQQFNVQTAYQDDGGGSVTAILRNDNGRFDVVSGSCDSSSNFVSQRSVFSGLFFVVKDPTLKIKEQTTSTISFKKTDTEFAQNSSDTVVKFNGKTYPMENGIIKIDGLKDGVEYEFDVEYTSNGVVNKAKTYAKTLAYDPGIEFNPLSRGFYVYFPDNDSDFFTSHITVTIDSDVIEIDNPNNKLTSYVIDGLQKDEVYRISYVYTMKNKTTGQEYTKAVDVSDYHTLEFDFPSIVSFEKEEKRGKVFVNFEYKDSDSRVTAEYLIIDGKSIVLEVTDGKYEITDIVAEAGKHTFKYEIEFLNGSNNLQRISSEVITITNEGEVTPNPGETPEPVNPEPVVTPKKKGCKKNSAASLILLSISLSAAILILKKKNK